MQLLFKFIMLLQEETQIEREKLVKKPGLSSNAYENIKDRKNTI